MLAVIANLLVREGIGYARRKHAEKKLRQRIEDMVVDKMRRIEMAEGEIESILRNPLGWYFDEMPEKELIEVSRIIEADDFDDKDIIGRQLDDVCNRFYEYAEAQRRQAAILQEVNRAMEENQKWQKYLDEFKQLNKSQQEYELNRLKTLSGLAWNNDQMHILELVYRDDAETTDYIIGNTKLFSIRRRK